MRKLFNWLFPVLLLLISLTVAFRNYTQGTWLLGWDNLVPELNFKLNIARSFSAVWQEYQGLGLLGGMAHAADLPRQLILFGSSFLMPVSFVRYFWILLMLVSGPLGIYFLIRTEKKFVVSLAAFSGAIFYLFNLATLQTFFTPFETFVSFYGFFPWLLYLAVRVLQKGKKSDLFIFALVSFLATSAFYVQPLFIVYAIFLSFFALEFIIRTGKSGLFRSVKLALVTFFVNAFWLLPVIYFALVSLGIPGNSHINSIATPETQIMNQARSGFTDVATLKGYWFDYFDWGTNGSYDYLYKEWIPHSSNFLVVGLSLGLFVVSVLGLILGLTGRSEIKFSYFLLLPICFFMLAGWQIPIPFFSEAFRNAFTKWSIGLVLILSVGIGSFVHFLESLYFRKLAAFLSVIASVCLISASFYTVYPVVNGNLIAGSMRVKLPGYYLDTIDYFKSQDVSKRIVAFPLTDFWGWQINDWGYRGSGFLWYGIPQPILSRTFDVWSPNNESFYNEISQAVIRKDVDNLKYVLNKYQVSYVLFDGSIIIPGNPNSEAILGDQKKFIESSGLFGKEKEFGKITIYKVTADSTNSFFSSPKFSYETPYISIGQVGGVTIKESFSDSQGFPQAKNCNLKGIGNVIKEKRERGNYYLAEGDGASCDYFYYSTLDTSKAYLMRISGKNISGRSLKFYLYDSKKQELISEELLPKGDFDKSFTILPTDSSPSAGLGYTLNVETRAFGKVKSENLIRAIEFYPVSSQVNPNPAPITNNLSVRGIQKYGTWGYKVDVQGEGLLQLGQGYEGGWVTIPSLQHLKINSWANGWMVPGGVTTVNIFYWPQLLEWGGMLALVLTLVVIGLY